MYYAFAALMSRMKYITRWGLMRNTRKESLSDHVVECTVTAHILAELAVREFGAQDVRPDRVIAAALYHDADEILTGDLPTPVKYKNESMLREYKKVESETSSSLTSSMPESIREDMRECLMAEGLTDHEKKIIKAADKLSALCKCIEEEKSGNREFASAKETTFRKLSEFDLDELRYFMDNFLPCYYMDLDNLINT
ncbi:MAG: 5'-deoxynucleotidase [Oscillospiraceae bacterium]|jgi:5'-deoxynucleotidase